MASAALEICDPVIELIKNPDSDQVMKQMGLAAIQSSVLVFGGQHSAKFVNVLDCIPDIVAEGSRGLKGSALATVAAVVKGLGLATVPYLPKVGQFPLFLKATCFVQIRTIVCDKVIKLYPEDPLSFLHVMFHMVSMEVHRCLVTRIITQYLPPCTLYE